MSTETSGVIKLSNVRLSFPELFAPKAFQPGQKPKYQATFLLDPSSKEGAAQIKRIKQAINDILIQHYGEGNVPKGIKVCLKDNEKEEKEYTGYDGMWFVSTSNTNRPTVVHRDLTPLTEEDEVMYPGCIVNASFTLWVQDNQYGKRVNANLRAVQFVKDAERLGGAAPVRAEEEFEAIEVADDGGDSDDIPW